MADNMKLKWYEKPFMGEITGVVTEMDHSATHLGTRNVTLYEITDDDQKAYCGVDGHVNTPNLGDLVQVIYDRTQVMARHTDGKWQEGENGAYTFGAVTTHWFPMVRYKMISKKHWSASDEDYGDF